MIIVMTTHRMTGTRFYRIWKAIKTRTGNPNYREYHYYGARGIGLYEPWKTFTAFMDDLYESYTEHVNTFGIADTQIDRIDGDKGYEPGNVRWVTKQEQVNNRKVVKRHTHNGVQMTLREISDETGIPYNTLYTRRQFGRPLLEKRKPGPSKKIRKQEKHDETHTK